MSKMVRFILIVIMVLIVGLSWFGGMVTAGGMDAQKISNQESEPTVYTFNFELGVAKTIENITTVEGLRKELRYRLYEIRENEIQQEIMKSMKRNSVHKDFGYWEISIFSKLHNEVHKNESLPMFEQRSELRNCIRHIYDSLTSEPSDQGLFVDSLLGIYSEVFEYLKTQ